MEITTEIIKVKKRTTFGPARPGTGTGWGSGGRGGEGGVGGEEWGGWTTGKQCACVCMAACLFAALDSSHLCIRKHITQKPFWSFIFINYV